jgi:hypothetical protein
MKKIINENNLIEIINDKKIKNWIKIKYILNFNDKINITGISKLLNITRMAVYKSIVLHNLNYDKTKRKRNVVLFKEKIKRDYKTYIIKDESNYLYKIGKSVNPKLREKTLQSEKPTIKMIKVFDYNIEKILHNEYKDFRVRGEWFDLNKVQINYICTKY